MKIQNRYAKQVSNREQPKKDDEGNVFGKVTAVGYQMDTKFGQPAIMITMGLEGENGGQIVQKLFYDIIFDTSKKGLTKLPRTMVRLDIISEEELIELLEADEVDTDTLTPILARFMGLELRFKSVLKNERFSIDYESVKLKNAPSSYIKIA